LTRRPTPRPEFSGDPTLLLDSVSSDRAEGWLFYCYSPLWGKPEHGRIPLQLAARSIKLTLE
jgi:hypothetical protein